MRCLRRLRQGPPLSPHPRLPMSAGSSVPAPARQVQVRQVRAPSLGPFAPCQVALATRRLACLRDTQRVAGAHAPTQSV